MNFLTSILSSLLGILGFQGCNIIQPSMYGCPSCDFTVKGTVTDEAGKPIKGIQVVVDGMFDYRKTDKTAPSEPYREFSDTLFTDADGKVEVRENCISAPNVLEISLTDVDGETGGLFESARLTSESIEQTKKGDGSWYNGAYEARFEAKMKRSR